MARLLFRSMKEANDGLPEAGRTARTLGIRPGHDVPAAQPQDLVLPGKDGMSVSPDDASHIPYFRLPIQLGGTGRDPVWSITEDDLQPLLQFVPDPRAPGRHGFIQPAQPMTLVEYEQA